MRLQPGTLKWMVWWNEEGGSRRMPGPPFLVSLEPLEHSGSLLGGEGLAPCRPEGDGDGLVPVVLPVGAGVPLHLGGVLADRGSVVGPAEVLIERLEPLEEASAGGAAPIGVAVLLERTARPTGLLHALPPPVVPWRPERPFLIAPAMPRRATHSHPSAFLTVPPPRRSRRGPIRRTPARRRRRRGRWCAP